MTPRRGSLAVLALLLTLTLAFPSPTQADRWEEPPNAYPAVVQAYAIPGQQAELVGPWLVAATGQPLLSVYDSATGQLSSSLALDGAPIFMRAAQEQLYVLTRSGTLYVFHLVDGQLVQSDRRTLNEAVDFQSASLFTLMAGPDGSTDGLAIGSGNTLSAFNLTGQLYWNYSAPLGYHLVDLQAAALSVLAQYSAAGVTNAKQVLLDAGTGQPLLTWDTGSAHPVLSDRSGSGDWQLFYGGADGKTIYSRPLRALNEAVVRLRVNYPIDSFSLGDDGLAIAQGDAVTVYNDQAEQMYHFTGSLPSKSYNLPLGNRLMLNDRELAIYINQQMMSGTKLPTGAHGASLQSYNADTLAISLGNGQIAVFRPAVSQVRQVYFGPYERFTYTLRHQALGPVTLSIFVETRIDLIMIPTKYTVYYQADGSSEAKLLGSGVISGPVVTPVFPDLAPGNLTLQVESVWFGPEYECQAIYGISLDQGLAGDLAHYQVTRLPEQPPKPNPVSNTKLDFPAVPAGAAAAYLPKSVDMQLSLSDFKYHVVISVNGIIYAVTMDAKPTCIKGQLVMLAVNPVIKRISTFPSAGTTIHWQLAGGQIKLSSETKP